MASSPPAAGKTSRWGSFLTGIESRLDTILADEDTASTPKADTTVLTKASKRAVLTVPTPQKGHNDSTARSASTSRAQDRLNEKLARARAARIAKKPSDVSTGPSNPPSRTPSPANVPASSRESTESHRDDNTGQSAASPSENLESNNDQITSEQQQLETSRLNALERSPSEHGDEPARTSNDSHRSVSPRLSLELIRNGRHDSKKINGYGLQVHSKDSQQPTQTIKTMRSDNDEFELRRQEEIREFMERIDALQSKLQYLTKEAAETAKRASAEAGSGSDAEKLAMKDEKIALLMEEGQKLSQTELKHMSIIKKLRARSTEDDKRLNEARRMADKHERTVAALQERVKKAETAEWRAEERLKLFPRLEKELEHMRVERDAQFQTIENLQKQLSNALAENQAVGAKVQSEALETERKRAMDLGEEISRISMEKEISEKHRLSEIRELKEAAERHKERAKAAEIERQAEQNILESRLEAFRARAEEASAGNTGDFHAKLLRQVETLQNQYAVASKNWQGIEGSLLARVAALEKERDELLRRESEARRKARESNARSKRLEENLEWTTARSQDLNDELKQNIARVSSLQIKISKSESESAELRKNLQAEREVCEAIQAQRTEDDHKQIEALAKTPESLCQPLRNQPPLSSSRDRKSSNPDKNSLHGRYASGLGIAGSAVDRGLSRRSSAQPQRSSDLRPISRQESSSFLVHQSPFSGAVAEMASITPENREDFFDGVRTPGSPDHTINDMISASTAGAGPSVQLVERMSAAVRRLESEKAASKDELIRLSQQRDEAREQVVKLMQEAEGRREVDERLRALETENQQFQERYLTTLEVLGEKSERVEELTADVADLKQMYRELVDSTMR